MQRVLDAIDAFWGYLAAVQVLPLAIGISCHMVKVMCTSRAWRNILAAAYPAERVRWIKIYAAYVAGVGVNAIFPARAGDVVRLYLAHRAIPTSTYTTLVSSTAVLTIVDFTIATGLFAWALTQGVLPSLDVLPDLPSFDFSWFLRHEIVSLVLLAGLLVAGVVLGFWVTGHIRELKQRVSLAFTIVRTPSRWLRKVVFWQLCDWGLRLATIWFFLDAFGIEQSVRNVLLVQATQSLATFVPVSPGGIGTEQAFLVYTLRGAAPRTALLAFSVGMRLTLTAVNVVVGFAAILLTLRTLRFRRATTPPSEATESGGA
jgi:glycosyltransferase 2 family protein